MRLIDSILARLKTPDGFPTTYTYPTIKWDAYIRRV